MRKILIIISQFILVNLFSQVTIGSFKTENIQTQEKKVDELKYDSLKNLSHYFNAYDSYSENRYIPNISNDWTACIGLQAYILDTVFVKPFYLGFKEDLYLKDSSNYRSVSDELRCLYYFTKLCNDNNGYYKFLGKAVQKVPIWSDCLNNKMMDKTKTGILGSGNSGLLMFRGVNCNDIIYIPINQVENLYLVPYFEKQKSLYLGKSFIVRYEGLDVLSEKLPLTFKDDSYLNLSPNSFSDDYVMIREPEDSLYIRSGSVWKCIEVSIFNELHGEIGLILVNSETKILVKPNDVNHHMYEMNSSYVKEKELELRKRNSTTPHIKTQDELRREEQLKQKNKKTMVPVTVK